MTFISQDQIFGENALQAGNGNMLGYSDAEIMGVLGENWFRIFKKLWGR
jgi:hypothetical protein